MINFIALLSEEKATLILVIIAVLLFILKKKSTKHRNDYIKLTQSEEEDLINSFGPESLVQETPSTHIALKPYIVSGKIGEYITIQGKKCVNFATHDYLGFINDSKIERKAFESIEKYGIGTCGPRCFYGTNTIHLQLESSLADFLGTESAIVYPFGFVTISSAVAAYAKKQDVIFVDQKINFAIQQGVIASKSEAIYFKHNDAKDLENLLEKTLPMKLLYSKGSQKSRRFLILEGIYVNTGKICPLPDFVRLAKQYKLRVFIDESISFGVLGQNGRGILEHFSIPREEVDITMGSFEHALASGGGFCAGSKFLVDHQVLSGLGYCFSASLPPYLVTAANEALKIIQENPEKIKKLKENSKALHNELSGSTVLKQWFKISGDEISPIHLLELKASDCDEDEVLADIMIKCFENNVVVTRAAKLAIDSAMLKGSLRLTSNVFQSNDQIINFVKVLESVSKEVFENNSKK